MNKCSYIVNWNVDTWKPVRCGENADGEVPISLDAAKPGLEGRCATHFMRWIDEAIAYLEADHSG